MRGGRTKSCGCNKRRLTTEERLKNKLFSMYQRRSKRINFEFDLTAEETLDLSKQNCNYCGSKPKNRYIVHEDAFYYSGFDRINSNFGYTSKNVVPCCKICNKAKSDLSVEEFEKHVLKIAEHLNII